MRTRMPMSVQPETSALMRVRMAAWFFERGSLRRSTSISKGFGFESDAPELWK